MNKYLVLYILLICLLTGFTQHLKTPCGIERWAVKTLTDKDTSKIDFTNIVETSIAAQIKLVPPVKFTKTLSRQPLECKVYSIICWIEGFKQEDDGDIHIVLTDRKSTLISEIPNPNCSELRHTSRYKQYVALWDYFKRNIGMPKSSYKILSVPIKVSITGVGFFDFIHGQTGVAPNGRELHPVLNIKIVK